ncbi:hypothetical protein PV761_10045 [Arthrobacter sp. CC3]|uniref:hypothetical protein n=1 Tax=Arthrobacter sp. CC3 TaxID=3029185 RepID=UPI00326789EC
MDAQLPTHTTWDRLSASFRIQKGEALVASAVYGKGYHAGKHDARAEDLLYAGVVLAVGVVISGGVKAYRKTKQAHAARLEQQMKDVDDSGNPEDPGQP